MENNLSKEGINLLIVEDQRIFVEGLLLILSRIEGFGNISYCIHVDYLMDTIRKNRPDVILMDFNMPRMDGVQCLKEILAEFPDQKVLMLTGYDDAQIIREALNIGAKGYILKNVTKDELVTAIKSVYNGDKYLDDSVQKKVLEAFLTNADTENPNLNPNGTSSPINLSNREKEVLQLIAEGQSSSKIANKLFISVNTVDTHRKNIMAKCGVKKITELITFANRNNLI